jgi:hypothetical protein
MLTLETEDARMNYHSVFSTNVIKHVRRLWQETDPAGVSLWRRGGGDQIRILLLEGSFWNTADTEEPIRQSRAEMDIRTVLVGEVSSTPSRAIRGGEPDAFLGKAIWFIDQGERDAALDLVYMQVDALLKDGRFDLVDSILKNTEIERLGTDLLLALLTTTLPARDKLVERGTFFERTERLLKRRGKWRPTLLAGLEN